MYTLATQTSSCYLCQGLSRHLLPDLFHCRYWGSNLRIAACQTCGFPLIHSCLSNPLHLSCFQISVPPAVQYMCRLCHNCSLFNPIALLVPKFSYIHYSHLHWNTLVRGSGALIRVFTPSYPCWCFKSYLAPTGRMQHKDCWDAREREAAMKSFFCSRRMAYGSLPIRIIGAQNCQWTWAAHAK